MQSFEGKPYLDLKTELDRARQTETSLVIVSLPGLGMNHYLKKYVEDNQKLGVKLINSQESQLGLYNILIWSRSWGSDVLTIFDNKFRQAGVHQKFGLGVTRPWLLETKEYLTSYLANHIYNTVYIRPFDEKDIDEWLKSRQLSLTKEKTGKLVEYSGGIPQLIKYLTVNQDSLDQSFAELLKDKNMVLTLTTMIDSISRCSQEVLAKMGITDKTGSIKSRLLAEVWQGNGRLEKYEIEVDFDLSITEKGVKTGKKLTLEEKKIIEKMATNNGKITKEEVSDVKWGEGKYDEYSDQAINKTMRRLGQKLTSYQIITIPKVGYKLDNSIDLTK